MPAVIAAYLVMELMVDYAIAETIAMMTVMALTLTASAVISKMLGPQAPSTGGGGTPLNTGTNVQVSPSNSNKLPILYGDAYIGGTITDLSITSDNQNLYYVLSLCEVTGNGTDPIQFGDIYFGGKKCLFAGLSYTDTGIHVTNIAGSVITYTGTLTSTITTGTVLTFSNSGFPLSYVVSAINIGAKTITFGVTLNPSFVAVGNEIYIVDSGSTGSVSVTGLQDTSTGLVDTKVDGHLSIYLYNNGSNSPVNSDQSAIGVMSSSGLVYIWDANKLMTNTAFAIVVLNYNSSASITSIQQTQFQVINSRTNTGDVIYDYLTNTIYGAAIPVDQIDTASLDALTAYSNELITFNNYNGDPETQPRFKFNGIVNPANDCLTNLNDMMNCCDCLLKYNEIYGKWSVIVLSTTYTVAMDINDSNMVSAITINTMDISNTYNIAQCEFPDITLNSSFNTSTVDLSIVDPSILYPNEPINSQTIKLPLINNDVTAQLIAVRNLKAARLDLQVQCTVNYIGLELEAGDIVTITNLNYGWTAKLMRLFKVEQNFGQDGVITVKLTMQAFDPNVYADTSITQYTPPPNSGLPVPNIFGTLTAPVIISNLTNIPVPTIGVQVTSSSAGITQYAEVWYSAYSNPYPDQLMLAGITAVQPSGVPYGNSVVLPTVFLTGIPAGNWYFFDRMINSLGVSPFSPASTVLEWRPATFQYSERYLSIAYADSITGTGFSYSPRGKTYYGIVNTSNPVVDITPSDYTWYLATPAFGSSGSLNYLLFCNRSNNLISFAVGGAAQSAGTALFVPTDTANYDPTIWQGLPDTYNLIDLTLRSGQLIQTGTTTVGTGEILVSNNPQGNVIASLAQLLDFGGAYTKTSSVATLTIDIYGRVVGFEAPDSFYYTMTAFDASASQTLFHVTRGTEYLSGNCWVLQNGLLLNPSEYTDTGGSTGNITLGTGANINDIITIISFASVATSGGTTYNSFTRNSDTLSNQGSYTASGFTLYSGYELLFLNGTVINAQDYSISGQTISFVNAVSGDLEVIQWANNNLGVPNGTPVNVDTYTTIGQAIYAFTFNPLAFNLWNNGALLLETVDYSVSTGSYTLAQTPTSNLNILVQQTFARTGAV